jgi:hypothetical protein
VTNVSPVSEFRFCGAPVTIGSNLCACHYRRSVFVTDPTKRTRRTNFAYNNTR